MVLYSLVKYFLTLFKFFLSIIKQKPTPQLKVSSISLSDIFFDLSHLKIFKILIFDKSIFTLNFDGTDLNIFSINPHLLYVQLLFY